MDIANRQVVQSANVIDKQAITAQRLKRLESIELKLRQTKMRLTQMQDIGGCRAVVHRAQRARDLAPLIATALPVAAPDQFSVVRTTDYLTTPKPDGYRGIHIVVEYDGVDEDYKKLKVEIQVRSRLQHVWATSVEICQFFTQQRFKTAKKTADEKWLRYFALASSYMALLERLPTVPNTPEVFEDIMAEMKAIDSETGIVAALGNWSQLVQPGFTVPDAYFYVLDLNGKDRTMRLESFRKDELKQAEDKYLELEKHTEGNLSRQIVLVSVESIDSLRGAYPNYFFDAIQFTSAVSAFKTPRLVSSYYA